MLTVSVMFMRCPQRYSLPSLVVAFAVFAFPRAQMFDASFIERAYF